jgi:hypothetical protein
MTLRDENQSMSEVVERFKRYDHPKARAYVRYYEENGHFPPGVWDDVQILDMRFNMQIAMGERPEDIEED